MSTEYAFKVNLFGLTVEVEGKFSPGEPRTMTEPGISAEFEVKTIKHKGENLKVESIPLEELWNIEVIAFDTAAAEKKEQQQ